MVVIKQIEEARRLLVAPVERTSHWSALAAAALMAVSAVSMAGAVVMGPGFEVRQDVSR